MGRLLGLLWLMPLIYAFWSAFHPPAFATRFDLLARPVDGCMFKGPPGEHGCLEVVTDGIRYVGRSNRVLFFDQGQIVEEGPPDVIFTNPQHERTQTFLKKIIAAGQRI